MKFLGDGIKWGVGNREQYRRGQEDDYFLRDNNLKQTFSTIYPGIAAVSGAI